MRISNALLAGATVTACTIIASGGTLLVAQGQQSTRDRRVESPVTGSGTLLPVVQDLDRSLEFYRDLLGLTFGGATVERPFGTNPVLLRLHGTPSGARFRVATARIAGSSLGIEMLEYKDIDRMPVHPRLQDPGAITVILQVRDLDTLLLRLKARGITVVTPTGLPVTLIQQGPSTRAVLVKDPDGFFVELAQSDSSRASVPTASNIIGASIALTVDDTERTLRFYRDLLGFRPQVSPSFKIEKSFSELTGLRQSPVRRSTAQVPGGDLIVDFLEFKADRSPVQARIQDPGAAVLNLKVRSTDSTLQMLKAASTPIVSVGGEPVSTGPERLAIVRDPSGFFIALRSPSSE